MVQKPILLVKQNIKFYEKVFGYGAKTATPQNNKNEQSIDTAC
jgi:hypothetical protein